LCISSGRIAKLKKMVSFCDLINFLMANKDLMIASIRKQCFESFIQLSPIELIFTMLGEKVTTEILPNEKLVWLK